MNVFGKTILIVAAAMVLPGVAARGQTGTDEPRGERRRGPGGREGMGFPQRDPVEALKQLRSALDDELKLNDEQLDAIDELFEVHVKHVEELRAEDQRKQAEHEGEIREIDEQTKAARESQDRDKMRELMRRRQELTRPSPELREAHGTFVSDVKAKLTEEDRAKFDGLVARIFEPQRGRGGAFMAILGAVRELELSDAQDAKIIEIRQKHMGAFRQAQSEGPEASEALAKQMRSEILAELTDEQKAQFQQAEERMKNNPRGGRGGPDGPRRERRNGGDR